MSSKAERVLSFEDARKCVETHAARIRSAHSVRLPLLQGLGRTLAEDIVADRDYPPFDRATRDGYAVHVADLQKIPAQLRVRGQVKAGSSYKRTVERGECVEIMTGAPVPSGADAVLMVEFTAQTGNSVEVHRSVRSGENIVPAGSEAVAGSVVLGKGEQLSATTVAVAATVGRAAVQVFQKPRVAILSTGDEVVKVENTPGPEQIRNSNAYSLAAQIVAAGGDPVRLRIAPDEKEALRELVLEGLRCDLLLLSGGVSLGKHDLVEPVLRELGADIFFTGAMIQPGRPVVFGCVRERYFFGLPGNPVSTMVTFELFAKALVQALAGSSVLPLRFASARLAANFKTKTGLTRFLPAVLSGNAALPEVKLLPWQGSGDVFTVAKSNCFLVVPPDRERLEGGEAVAILLI